MDSKTAIALVLVTIIVLGGLGWYGINKMAQSFEDSTITAEKVASSTNICGEDNTGTPYFCAYDAKNTSRHCMAETVYLYQETTPGEYEYASISKTLTDKGTPTSLGTAISCQNEKGVPINYRGYFQSVNIGSGQADASGTGGYSGGYIDFTMTSANPTVMYNTPKIHTIVFRFWDKLNNGYIYAEDAVNDIDGNSNTTGYQQNTQEFTWNTTVAPDVTAAITTLGADAEMDGTLYVKVHATNSTTAIFGSETLNNYIAVDIQSGDDWDINSINIGGLSEVDVVPTRIGNLNYDIVFDANDVMPFTKTATTLDWNVRTIGGVNPDDDIHIGFFFEGYFLSEGSFDMKSGVSKDDSTKTIIFTHQYLDIIIS